MNTQEQGPDFEPASSSGRNLDSIRRSARILNLASGLTLNRLPLPIGLPRFLFDRELSGAGIRNLH